jgi:hypothetical protein
MKRKPRRGDLGPGEVLCSYCTAKCCRYFALPIDTPKTWKDYDDVRWYLAHDQTAVFVEEGKWYLLVHTTCQYLQGDHRCGNYHERMQICRDYTTANCEYDDDAVYDKYFETPEQLAEYAEAMLPPRRRAPWTRQKNRLPVLVSADASTRVGE